MAAEIRIYITVTKIYGVNVKIEVLGQTVVVIL